jgi:hypothetical protein
MTSPRRHIDECPCCHLPAISGMVGSRCYLCTFDRISDAALAEVTAYHKEKRRDNA